MADSDFKIISSSVKVNSTEIIFSSLELDQYLADTSSFSFLWRLEEGRSGLAGHVAFYRQNLSKEVEITIGDRFIFKGFVTYIECVNEDDLGSEYKVLGKGMFEKLDQVPECNSFYKKTVSQIFNELNKAKGTTLRLDPAHKEALFYTVQYNQTTFEFYKMLAARYGEWLYYTGTELVMAKPGQQVINLKIGEDIHDSVLSAKAKKVPLKASGYDRYTGQPISSKEKNYQSAGMADIGVTAGNEAFGDEHNATSFLHAPNKEALTGMHTLHQQSVIASIVYFTCRSYDPAITIGSKIKLTEANGSDAGEYIVIGIDHHCQNSSNYHNEIFAVPADVEVPPYTQPFLFPVCKPQYAIVKDNEDKDGLDRIKVQFPWQHDANTSPWLHTVSPYSGKGKGFRFLPEKGEEVLVDFIDHNAEKPFIVGTVFTEANKSGVKETGNHMKVLGSRSNRRLEINDDEGTLKLTDNYTDQENINSLHLKRKDADTFLWIQSLKDGQNHSALQLNSEDTIKLSLSSGGEAITTILMEKGGKKITIDARAEIMINADEKITMKSKEININASQKVNITGSQTGVSISGQKVDMTANSSMTIKGMNTSLQGSAQLDMKGGPLASLVATLVKIN